MTTEQKITVLDGYLTLLSMCMNELGNGSLCDTATNGLAVIWNASREDIWNSIQRD